MCSAVLVAHEHGKSIHAKRELPHPFGGNLAEEHFAKRCRPQNSLQCFDKRPLYCRLPFLMQRSERYVLQLHTQYKLWALHRSLQTSYACQAETSHEKHQLKVGLLKQ